MTFERLFRMVDENAAEVVGLLTDLIRFETVNTGVMPTGDELPLCRFVQEKLAAEGVASQVLLSAENRGNLIARLPGRPRLPGSRGAPRLMLMGHSDVVPVEDASEWRFPPFSGAVADGRVWGRGAADMKDTVAAELMALIFLRRAGIELKGDLIVAIGADEEAGGTYGFGWLAAHAPQAIEAEYAINESGGGPIPIPGGLAYTIQTGEKGRLEVHITLRGRASHAASPWMADNALFKLAEVLQRLHAWQPELDVLGETFAHLPALLGRAEPVTPRNVDVLADELGVISRQLGSAVRGLSRMTLTPTMIKGGVKSNSIPAACELVCDVRTLPHQDEAYVRRQVEEILTGIEGASYELVWTAVSNASPYDTELTAALRRATAAAAGRDDLKWLPSLTTGFTDSRLVRPLGTITYGFTPDHPAADLTHPAGVHGINESSEVLNLLFRTKLFLALAVDVLG
jgi:acetylornithine deacetylase/succinyl-diaminopimelate desuccinylase-like protein